MDLVRSDPLYRAFVEAVFAGFLLYAFSTLWGPTLGIVYSTTGTLPLTLLSLVFYVIVRGVWLARRGYGKEEK